MDTEETKVIGGGLLPLPPDARDFSRTVVFGAIEELPEQDFIVAKPLLIKDQGETDFCSAFATTSVSEDQEGVNLNPFFQFAKTKQIQGEWKSWGADLRSACKAQVKVGAILMTQRPFDMTADQAKNRDYLANWNNWPLAYDDLAAEHKKESYFSVDGPYDFFDNVRMAMWIHRTENRSILTGSMWHREWTRAPAGVIPKDYGPAQFGHAFKIFGQKRIGGELYLMAQLSNGTDIGDKGIFYFPREVVNKEFGIFGGFMFADIPRELAEYYASNGKEIGTGLIAYLQRLIVILKLKIQALQNKNNPMPVTPPAPVAPAPKPLPEVSKLYEVALEALGSDASPSDKAPDDLACAESVSTLINKAYGDFPPVIGTADLWDKLRKHPKFKVTLEIKAGTVIVSPTGRGNGSIEHGHTGICLSETDIASNDSRTGLFQKNFTVTSWVNYFRHKGGFPLYCFERTNI